MSLLGFSSSKKVQELGDNEIAYGRHIATLGFIGDNLNGSQVIANVGEYTSAPQPVTPVGIADAVKDAVAQKVSAEQAEIDRWRAIEDARHLLGN